MEEVFPTLLQLFFQSHARGHIFSTTSAPGVPANRLEAARAQCLRTSGRPICVAVCSLSMWRNSVRFSGYVPAPARAFPEIFREEVFDAASEAS